ncbi:amidohydrolase family protein [Steroidobacter sp.]|uniref:amidohydrolase family protein n=1 Tax=Steroidobacter sp. TaxID=1978227 RepID=UPI0025DAFD01|nr:amidohydrolase family protein [Steroidobacter sp.]
MSVDVAPDGGSLFIDLLGDIYRLAIGGGPAQPLITGPSFDMQPVISPNGAQIAFISDRNGSENLWLADANGANPRALSDATDSVFTSPSWSADGQSIYVTRFSSNSRMGATSGALWIYHRLGGGVPLDTAVGASPARGSGDATAIGVSPSPDGQFLYFAATDDTWSSYRIYRRDLRSGVTITLIAGLSPAMGAGGVMQPVVSPDGALLAYAADVEGRTELRLRTLRTGEDRRLVFPIEASLSTHYPFYGVLPRYSFTPDSKAIVIAHDGKIWRIDVATGRALNIPFVATVDSAISPRVTRQPRDATGAVRARVIQSPRLSPDGRQLAFSAFGKLYIAALPGGAPQRLTRTDLLANEVTENQPVWSSDGRWLVYASWSRAAGGHLWRVRSDGSGDPQRLTQQAAYYRNPAYTPDGKSIVALRSSVYDQLNLYTSSNGWPMERSTAQEVIRIAAAGGPSETLTELPANSNSMIDHGRFHFAGDDAALVYTGEGLMAVPLKGGAGRRLLRVKQQVDDLRLSPDGRWALAIRAAQLHLFAIPPAGSPEPEIDLEQALAHRQITEIGADDFAWSADGREITWSVGSMFYRVALSAVLAAPATAGTEGCAEDRWNGVNISVELPRDVPGGQLVLRGATVVTMRGEEIFERADVVIDGNRISAVAPVGSVKLAKDAIVKDVSGKFITPGFVDTHAHYMNLGRPIIDYDVWQYRAALAFGVTTSFDPQSFTSDAFVYQDLLDAGIIAGPHAYTVGRGIFGFENSLTSVRQAKCILQRYQQRYHTGSVKAYLLGNRQKRQYLAKAALEMGMMTVTENWGAPPPYALTQVLDGFSTNEHASGAVDFYRDVAMLYAQAGTGYSPTTQIGGAALLRSQEYFTARRNPLAHEKLNHFTPRFVLDARLRRGVPWATDADYNFPRRTASATRSFRAGGNVGVGSHGEVQGLGYHWEMLAYAMGGATPHEVLQIATRSSAHVIGRQDEVGTLEPGKFADLLIFERNPLLDIANSEAIGQVMKNGRLYDASTLAEVWPRQRPSK